MLNFPDLLKKSEYFYKENAKTFPKPPLPTTK